MLVVFFLYLSSKINIKNIIHFFFNKRKYVYYLVENYLSKKNYIILVSFKAKKIFFFRLVVCSFIFGKIKDFMMILLYLFKIMKKDDGGDGLIYVC